MEDTLKELDVKNELRDYQMEYYDKLSNASHFHSLVCIPTGGGKTRLAVVYLINKILMNNIKVLWLTHSQYLLNQAYDTFLSYLGKEWMDRNAILIHSGEHPNAKVRRLSDLKENHKLIICSFQSMLKTSVMWKEIIGDQTIVVIDEAHHIAAESYLGLVQNYVEDKNMIGLTATPIRMKSSENYILYSIFNDDLKVKVHMTRLFEKGYLVRPLFEIVNYSNEQIDDTNISKIDELDQYLVENSADYNNVILDKYASDEEKYRKTVIFAINKQHADSLYELFCKKYGNNRVFIVYSNLLKTNHLPSLAVGEDRDSQFRKFKESHNGILININVLNEGVDIPDIQTVFLTKPLNSKTTVTQIIGRALRPAGPKKCAYIVNFAVSNLGKKLLMVMPKNVYNQYAAEWESEEAADEYEENEERVSELSEIVEKVKKKADVCSFSDICLAGNYMIISRDEQEDIPVPVSFKEYRKIERFRNGIKAGKACSFPKRLFFFDAEPDLVKSAFENENRTVDISFKPYDSEFLDGISQLLSEITIAIKDLYVSHRERQAYDIMFSSKYNELKNNENAEILWYLDQVGIRTEKDFVYFMRQELPLIKQQIKEEM